MHIKDEELRFIAGLLDNQIINKLLAYKGYSPAMRNLLPSLEDDCLISTKVNQV